LDLCYKMRPNSNYGAKFHDNRLMDLRDPKAKKNNFKIKHLR